MSFMETKGLHMRSGLVLLEINVFRKWGAIDELSSIFSLVVVECLLDRLYLHN